MLEKATNYEGYEPVVFRTGNEHYELAVAWINGKITNSQVAIALELRTIDEIGNEILDCQTAVTRMGKYLREATKRGFVKIT